MSTAPVSGEAARRASNPAKFGAPAPLSAPRIAKINSLRSSDPHVLAAWNEMVGEYPLDRTPAGPINPFQIPNVYTDPTGNSAAIVKVRYDGIAALNFAIRYAISGDNAAAVAACNQIQPWTTITSFVIEAGTDTRLSWSYSWPLFLSAAMLVKDSPAYAAAGFDANLRAVTIEGRRTCSTAFTNPSNQGAWGVVLEMSAAVFLGEQARFDRAVQRWREVFNEYIKNDLAVEEIYRQGGGQGNGSSGRYYSDFMACALTYGAEWARLNGVWLYDHVSPDGSTLKGFAAKVAGWNADPASYPYNSSGTVSVPTELMGHWVILNELWPDANKAAILASLPVVDRYGFRYLKVTHAKQPLRG